MKAIIATAPYAPIVRAIAGIEEREGVKQNYSLGKRNPELPPADAP